MTPDSLRGARPATAFAAAEHDATAAAGAAGAGAAGAAATPRSGDACNAPAWRPNTPRGDAPPQPTPRRPSTVAAAPNTDGGATKPNPNPDPNPDPDPDPYPNLRLAWPNPNHNQARASPRCAAAPPGRHKS